jgi:hypothetical protein
MCFTRTGGDPGWAPPRLPLPTSRKMTGPVLSPKPVPYMQRYQDIHDAYARHPSAFSNAGSAASSHTPGLYGPAGAGPGGPQGPPGVGPGAQQLQPGTGPGGYMPTVNGGGYQAIQEEDKIYALVIDLMDGPSRETALLELSKKREQYDELALVLWHSFGECGGQPMSTMRC